MKKEENQKRNIVLKNDQDLRSRSHSPKAYLGCLTCQLRKTKSNNKLNDYGVVHDKIKIKTHALEKNERGHQNHNVKLTDLCDEDKKRIVELIEELSKLAEKNQQLKEALDRVQKERQEQQDYLMKQAKLHLEEKNFYVNEINEFKSRIETFDSEMRNKIIQWENRERCKDSEIAYLAKALQKTLREKNQLHEQMDHLKICLKHSLESFQRLRAEVSELQRQELLKKHKTASSQTENKSGVLKEKYKASDQDTEDEFLSTCNQDSVNAKSSLDIINDKLEYVYQILKRKGENLTNATSEKHEIDLSFILRNDNLEKNLCTENFPFGIREAKNEDKSPKAINEENECKFQKPFEQCSKTSVQAERILKNFGKPLSLTVNEDAKKQENNNTSNKKSKESARDSVTYSNFLYNKIIQKNTLFKSREDHQYDEDKLLEELFYPDQSVNFGLGLALKPEDLEMKKTYERTFTWFQNESSTEFYKTKDLSKAVLSEFKDEIRPIPIISKMNFYCHDKFLPNQSY